MKKIVVICILLIELLSMANGQWGPANFFCADLLQKSDPGKQHSKNITITLDLDKSVYVVGENIFLNVKYRNTGELIDSLRYLSEPDISTMVLLYKEGIGKAPYRGMDNCRIGFPPFRKLIPGEEKILHVDLFYSYGLESENARNFSNNYFFPSGKYYVSSFYHDYENGVALVSDTVSFEVVEPAFEQKEELSELRKIYKMETKTESEKIDKIIAYKGFTLKYPESIYYQEAFSNYMSMRGICQILSTNTSSESIGFLEKFPNSHYVGTVLWCGMDASLLHYGKEAAKNFLRSIELSLPDTRASLTIKDIKRTDYYLQKIPN